MLLLLTAQGVRVAWYYSLLLCLLSSCQCMANAFSQLGTWDSKRCGTQCQIVPNQEFERPLHAMHKQSTTRTDEILCYPNYKQHTHSSCCAGFMRPSKSPPHPALHLLHSPFLSFSWDTLVWKISTHCSIAVQRALHA